MKAANDTFGFLLKPPATLLVASLAVLQLLGGIVSAWFYFQFRSFDGIGEAAYPHFLQFWSGITTAILASSGGILVSLYGLGRRIRK
jgi:hypothetical protein